MYSAQFERFHLLWTQTGKEPVTNRGHNVRNGGRNPERDMQSNFLTNLIQPIQAKSNKDDSQADGQTKTQNGLGFMATFQSLKAEKNPTTSEGLFVTPSVGDPNPEPTASVSLASFSMTGNHSTLPLAREVAPDSPPEITTTNMGLIRIEAMQTPPESDANLNDDMLWPGRNAPISANSSPILTNDHILLSGAETGRDVPINSVGTTDSGRPVDESPVVGLLSRQVTPQAEPISVSVLLNNGRITNPSTETVPVVIASETEISPSDPLNTRTPVARIDDSDPSILLGNERPIDRAPHIPVLTQDPILVGRHENVAPTGLRQPAPATPLIQGRSHETPVISLSPNASADVSSPAQLGTVATSNAQSSTPVEPALDSYTGSQIQNALIPNVEADVGGGTLRTEGSPLRVALPIATPMSTPDAPLPSLTESRQPSPVLAVPMPTSDAVNSPLGLPQNVTPTANMTGQLPIADLPATLINPLPRSEPTAPDQSSALSLVDTEISAPKDVLPNAATGRASETVFPSAAVPKEPSVRSGLDTIQPLMTIKSAETATQADKSTNQVSLMVSRGAPQADSSEVVAWPTQRATADRKSVPIEVQSALTTGYTGQKPVTPFAPYQPAKPVTFIEQTAPSSGQTQTKTDVPMTTQAAPIPAVPPTGFAMAPQPQTQSIKVAVPISDSASNLTDIATEELSALPEELGRTNTTETMQRDIQRPTTELRMTRHVAAQLLDVARQLPDRPMEISLNPEELGRVKMTLSANENTISVTLMAERGETADLLRRNLETLSQEFRELGYSEISFSFAGDDAQQQGENDSGQTADSSHFLSDEIDEASLTPNKITLDGGVDIRL